MKIKEIKLSDLPKGSWIYNVAKAKIKHGGFYNCKYKDELVTVRN